MRNISGITSITVITAPFYGQNLVKTIAYCPEPAHEGNGWQANVFHEPAVLRVNINFMQ